MLTVEEIKKIHDNFEVEGFEVKTDKEGDYYLCFPNRAWMMIDEDMFNDTNFQTIYYPLYLQKVIHAINKKDGFAIEQRKRDYVAGAYGKFEYQANKTNTINDNELVIKYILGRL